VSFLNWGGVFTPRVKTPKRSFGWSVFTPYRRGVKISLVYDKL